MATRYLTTAVFKTYLRSELTLEDTAYDAAINAAELWLDNKCQRRFEVASSTTARVFSPLSGQVLIIHDCTAITTVVDNGTTLVTGTDYQPEPLNAITAAGDPSPYYRLRRLNGYWYSWNSKATVTVTATWGWAAIPLSIVEACKIVAKDFFEQRDVTHGILGFSEAGGIGTRENRLVQDAVNQYRHPNTIGIA